MIDTETRPLHVPLVRKRCCTRFDIQLFIHEARLVFRKEVQPPSGLYFSPMKRKQFRGIACRTVNPDHGVKVTGAVSNAKSVGVPGYGGRPASAASIPGTVTTPSAKSGSDYIIGLESTGPISGCVRAKGVAIMRSECASPAARGGRDLGTNSEESRASRNSNDAVQVVQCSARSQCSSAIRDEKSVGPLTRTVKRRTSRKALLSGENGD